MRHRRGLPSECAIDQEMFRNRGDPLLAAHDVRDPHLVVIDDDGEVVGRKAIRLQNDLILDRVGLPLDVACTRSSIASVPSSGTLSLMTWGSFFARSAASSAGMK